MRILVLFLILLGVYKSLFTQNFNTFLIDIKPNFYTQKDNFDDPFYYDTRSNITRKKRQFHYSIQLQAQYFINETTSIGLVSLYEKSALKYTEEAHSTGALIHFENDPDYSIDKTYPVNDIKAKALYRKIGFGFVQEKYFNLTDKWIFSLEQNLIFSYSKNTYEHKNQTFGQIDINRDTENMFNLNNLDVIVNGQYEVVNSVYTRDYNGKMFEMNWSLLPNIHLKIFKNSFISLSIPVLNIGYSKTDDPPQYIIEDLLYSNNSFAFDGFSRWQIEPAFSFENVFLGWSYSF